MAAFRVCDTCSAQACEASWSCIWLFRKPLQKSLGVLRNAGFAFRCGPGYGMTGKGMAGEHSDSP